MSLSTAGTKKQGDVGVGRAIAYFTGLGYSVSVPLTESQRYDLVVDDESRLYRVEVKTTRHRRNEKSSYIVLLSTQGGNRTWSGKKRAFSMDDADLVFVSTDGGNNYLFPSDLLDGKSNLSLTSKLDRYIVS